MSQSLAFSRRANSVSTASRMNMARLFGPAKASIRSRTSGSKRTSVGLSPSAGLPMRARLAGIALSDNVCIKPLSLIDGVTDNGYITVIANGDNPMAFQLDTTGHVLLPHPTPEDPAGNWASDSVQWSDLSPFAQGYIEALAADNFARIAAMPSDNDQTGHCKWCGRDNRGEETGPCSDDCPRQEIRFSNLAPETLAQIIADCEFLRRAQWGDKSALIGGWIWQERQMDHLNRFPPLTVQLGDDGKVRFGDTPQ